MRRYLASLAPALLMLLATTVACAATLYRWVDRNGVVHYSDRPEAGATVVEQQEAQTFSAAENTDAASTQRPPLPPVAAPAYTQLDLWKPQNGDTFTNTGNTIEVRLRVEPELQPGHAIWLYLDGKRVDGLPQTGDTFTLDNVWRGSHTLNATVADRAGVVLIRSQSVSFEMHQASLLAPNRQPQPQPRRP